MNKEKGQNPLLTKGVITTIQCKHKRLLFFKQHYRCRNCQNWWAYPHLTETRNTVEVERS